MPTEPRIRASVVIGTRNRISELQSCLASVSAALGPRDELIVVDSASENGAAVREIVETAQARYYRAEIAGAARARNMGIRQARGGIIAFTDDDAVVAPDWLEKLVEAFADERVAAAVGPVFELGAEPKRLLIEYRSFQADRDAVSFSRDDKGWFERLAFGAIGVGANIAVRRETFDRVGLFEESLGQGMDICGDENFFLFSAVNQGLVVANQPLAAVYHPLQTPGRQAELDDSRVAYLAYLFFRWPSAIPQSALRFAARFSRPSRPASGDMQLPGTLVRAILKAPGLLLASCAVAWRRRRHRA